MDARVRSRVDRARVGKLDDRGVTEADRSLLRPIERRVGIKRTDHEERRRPRRSRRERAGWGSVPRLAQLEEWIVGDEGEVWCRVRLDAQPLEGNASDQVDAVTREESAPRRVVGSGERRGREFRRGLARGSGVKLFNRDAIRFGLSIRATSTNRGGAPPRGATRQTLGEPSALEPNGYSEQLDRRRHHGSSARSWRRRVSWHSNHDTWSAGGRERSPRSIATSEQRLARSARVARVPEVD